MAHSEVTTKDTWTTLLIYRFQVFGSIYPVMCQEYNMKGIWYLIMNQRIKARGRHSKNFISEQCKNDLLINERMKPDLEFLDGEKR